MRIQIQDGAKMVAGRVDTKPAEAIHPALQKTKLTSWF